MVIVFGQKKDTKQSLLEKLWSQVKLFLWQLINLDIKDVFHQCFN